LNVEKKPYRLKFDTKINLLGLNNGNKFKSWVLLADYFDTSLLRNFTSFNLAKVFDFYSSDCQHVELYLNGEYLGIYLLAEQQQIDKKRINIEEYKEGQAEIDNTGYLLEEDFSWRVEEPCISASLGGKELWFDIKSDTYEESQIAFIQSYIREAFEVLDNTESTELDASTYFDLNSAVDMFLYCLIICDGDPNSSFYLAKDKDGKIQFCAPWDEDWALGNDRDHTSETKVEINNIVLEFAKFDWFNDLLVSRYNEKKAQINSILDTVTNEKELLAPSIERHFEKWDLIGKITMFQPAIYETFDSYDDYFDYLYNYLAARLSFVETYIGALE